MHHRHSRGDLRRVGAVVTMLGLLLLTSCAGDSDAIGAESPDDRSTSAPAATSPAEGLDDGGGGSPEMKPTPVRETSELVSEHLSSWQEYSTPSETELQMAFYSGNPACYGVRAVVEETDTQVRVATISGTLPDAINSACTQEARYVALVIELDQPLGEREVVPLNEVELTR
ncbi:hypothetical protein I2485_08315 [Nesterenkonia sp. E16_7]|uniref:hypothetical protein n=1 Tax=unclassified Nesterenkonia TaxID=2629769 RepID=UPI001A92F737|nr:MULTISPECIES: hypothetical protein [unclassified Nesterenkonia]MBO0595002.1 hypothetical protein [Nesterenkonia sp. E16_10]MBO0598657.1 hypothetical protein [Nesterenkonia sp. E16_7]